MRINFCGTLTNRGYDYDGVEEGAGEGPLRFEQVLVAIPAVCLDGRHDLLLKVGQVLAHIRHPIALAQHDRIVGEQPNALGEIEAQVPYVPLDLLGQCCWVTNSLVELE